MKKLFYSAASVFLGATFLFSSIPVLAEDYTPFSISVGGTGSTTIEGVKESLEIPSVIDSTSGDSSTDTMSQRAIKECIAAGSGGGIITTGDPGSSTSLVIHQKGVTDYFISKDDIVHNDQESSMTKVVSQKGLKDSIENALNTLPQFTIEDSTGQYSDRAISQRAVTDALSTVVQDSIVQATGNQVDKVMSQKAVSEAILTAQNIFNMIYPVGAIYMSVNPVNPGALFDGNWTAWGQGRVPVGVNTSGTFNTVEKMGGSESHILTTAEMPSHVHTGPSHTHTSAAHSHEAPSGSQYYTSRGSSSSEINGMAAGSSFEQSGATGGVRRGGTSTSSTTPGATGSSGTGNTGSAGSGSAHNNLQPYITCYMWKRVS